MPGISKYSGIYGSGFDGPNLSNHRKYQNSNFAHYLTPIHSFQEHAQVLMLKADEKFNLNPLLFNASIGQLSNISLEKNCLLTKDHSVLLVNKQFIHV